MNSNESIFYRRHLPHYQPVDATFFVTFRLNGSLPLQFFQRIRDEKMIAEQRIRRKGGNVREALQRLHKRYFQKYDELLDACTCGPTWLKQPELADIVAEAIHYRHQRAYDLYAWCIMPNHVHLVFQTNSEYRKTGLSGRSTYWLANILENLKWYTAKECNKVLKRTGTFWQHESYDHVVRNPAELDRIVYYVLNNPVQAKLVKEPEEYRYSWCAQDFF